MCANLHTPHQETHSSDRPFPARDDLPITIEELDQEASASTLLGCLHEGRGYTRGNLEDTEVLVETKLITTVWNHDGASCLLEAHRTNA